MHLAPITDLQLREPAGVQDLVWCTRDEGKKRLGDIPDSHLRNIALMLMGMGYQTVRFNDEKKVRWLTVIRMEWERRQRERIQVSDGEVIHD